MTYYSNRPSQLALANDTVASAVNTGGAAGASLTPTITNGGTVTYQTGRWRFRRGATNSAARLQLALESSGRYTASATFELVESPAVESRILMLMSSPTIYAALITITTSGVLRVHNSLNQIVYQTPAIGVGKFRVHLGIEYAPEPSVVDGKIRFSAFVGSNVQGTTPDYAFSSDEMSTGTGLLNSLWVGHANSSTTGHDFYLVDLQADSSTVALLPPLQAGAPTAQAVASTQSFALVDARTSQSGGGTLSYVIAPMTGVTQLASGWWAVERTMSAVNYTVTVTDSLSSLQSSTVVTVDAQVVATPIDYTGYTQTLVYSGGSWT